LLGFSAPFELVERDDAQAIYCLRSVDSIIQFSIDVVGRHNSQCAGQNE
jgi:hypothetical protein